MAQIKNSVAKIKHSVRNVSLGFVETHCNASLFTQTHCNASLLTQPLHSVWNASILQHTDRIPDGMRCFVAFVFYRAIIPDGIVLDIQTIT